nr:hypothetical protein [Candidatus Sigynarchaeota archaeon]
MFLDKKRSYNLHNMKFLKLMMFASMVCVVISSMYVSYNSRTSSELQFQIENETILKSDLVGANLTVVTDKIWYKNNSNVKISGSLQTSGQLDGYTIIIEIYFEGESDPTYQLTATTTMTGYYERNFIHGNGKEGVFTVWVNVLLHANPRNSTT